MGISFLGSLHCDTTRLSKTGCLRFRNDPTLDDEINGSIKLSLSHFMKNSCHSDRNNLYKSEGYISYVKLLTADVVFVGF